MRKAYILVHDATFGSREMVKSYLNSMPIVEKWRTDLPSCFYLICSYPAKIISEQLREVSSGKGRFIVSEISSDSYGWLTSESWYLIQKHEYKPKA